MTLMRILRFAGTTFLQVLKIAVSFVTATVATLFLLLASTYLQRELGFGWMEAAREYAWTYVGSAVFLGCFYETFNLFEMRMTARKKVLVTSLGVVFLTSYFSLSYVVRHAQVPAPDIAEFFRWAGPPSPSKPYEEAMYDVCSDLLQPQPPSLSDRWIVPPQQYSGGVAILDETLILSDGCCWPAPTPEGFQDRHSNKAFKLQRKFNLPNYVLITKTDEDHIFRSNGEWLAFQRNYPGYFRFVELYGVDFNKDQTRASVNISDQYAGKDPYRAYGKHLELEKQRNGKWRVTRNDDFSISEALY